jgi:Ca-activated chloride channel family protein
MDLSTSMLARDFHPSRLEVSKKVASEFVDKRKYDRIGLVVFSGESYTQCPVTSDHAIVKSFIEMQETGLLTDGTAIGMGVATAVSRLKDSDAKSKIIILLTDGVNNAGYIDPDIAIEMAVGSDIKIYTIGVGSEGVAMMPISRNLNGEFIYGPQQVNIDETLLTDIANRTGGKYFRATDVESLTKIYNTIDQLEKSEIETNVFRRYNERFKPFAWCAFALMLFSSILNKSILRTFP